MEKEKIIKKDRYLSRFINFYIMFIPIYYILNLAIGTESHYIFATIIILFFIVGIKHFNGFRKKAIWFSLLFFGLFLIYSFVGYEGYIYNWSGMVFMLFCCAWPWFIVGIYVDDFKSILQGFKKIMILAWVTNIMLIAYCYLNGRPMSGNMEISYSILPLSIISIYFAIKEKKILYLLSTIASVLVILGIGSRGPLLCIAVFIILYLLEDFKRNKLIILFFTLLVCFTFFNYTNILNGLIDFFEKYDINSRTLYKIRDGSIENDNGRGNIQEVAWNQLKDHPILGTGIGVERIKINQLIMNKDMGSSYPHNIIVEIMTQYGYIIGTMIILYLSCLFIISLLKSNSFERELLIIIFSTEIIRLMLSSSYLRSSFFFLWLGLSINIVYRKRRKKVEEHSDNITDKLANTSN